MDRRERKNHGSSSVLNEEYRLHPRAELDGLCGHLYELERDELATILDTFPIVKRKDEEAHGTYRTKRLVLEAYDALAGVEMAAAPEEDSESSCA